MLPETLEWRGDVPSLRLLDQRKIPREIAVYDCKTYEETALAIENMTVRGAPAIGVAAAYGVVLAARESAGLIAPALQRLAGTRPTAVNLYWALERMKKIADANGANENISLLLEAEAIKIHDEDIETNKKLSRYGQTLLPQRANVITHCNAGAIATAGYGTALGVLRAAREKGKKIRIFADETRPRLQGGLLTAFELFEDGFDVTVICDSMAAFLMQREKIDAVIVGADRISANGDTANKIGTYSLAICAKAHNVPFYVAAPVSTIDINCPNGTNIPIEERDGDEIRSCGGRQIIPGNINVWNPAFDITPAEFISGIITEMGIIEKPYDVNIAKNCFVIQTGGLGK